MNRKSDSIPRTLTPLQSNVDINSTQTASALTQIVSHTTNSFKPSYCYAILAHVIIIFSFPKKPIAISIINPLPSINLYIHNPDDDENRMHMLVDNGATINTRNLQYHLWVISQCPEMADEYLKCGKNIVYDVIHLLAVLDLKNTDRDVDHGKMTAVINYRTPYIVQVRDSFILSFDL